MNDRYAKMKAAFEKWQSQRGVAAIYEGDGQYEHHTTQREWMDWQDAWQAATEAANAASAQSAQVTQGEFPPLPYELYEEYPVMGAHAHEAAVKKYGQQCAEAARQPAPVVPEIVEIDAIEILREFVADSHEHDVGGGDLVITTCEVREKAVALLKLLQDPELGECGCKPSDCPNNQKCKCVAATNRSQP